MLDFIMRHKLLFYLIQFTWGIGMNILGFVVSLALLCTGHKPYKFGYGWYFKVGYNWGGCSFGICFICGMNDDDRYLKYHESGHGIQNVMFGPLFAFVVAIPSFIRYWYREFKFYKKGKLPTTEYDDIWFEGQASELGKKYFIYK